ncbi:hypothetical protein ACS0TY_006823 [Phlomoides rotata]
MASKSSKSQAPIQPITTSGKHHINYTALLPRIEYEPILASLQTDIPEMAQIWEWLSTSGLKTFFSEKPVALLPKHVLDSYVQMCVKGEEVWTEIKVQQYTGKIKANGMKYPVEVAGNKSVKKKKKGRVIEIKEQSDHDGLVLGQVPLSFTDRGTLFCCPHLKNGWRRRTGGGDEDIQAISRCPPEERLEETTTFKPFPVNYGGYSLSEAEVALHIPTASTTEMVM